MFHEKKRKILLTGGGTAGSVSPLLAIYSRLKHPPSLALRSSTPRIRLEERAGIDNGFKKSEFLWLGTKSGPERKMVADYGIPFKPIFSGKLRRYFDLRNFLDIFKIIIGFKQASWIIFRFKPDIILSAGSFVSVPVVWAGWLLGKKILIHQQDVRPGLANKLMAPFATKITVTFRESLKHFPESKTIWTGNPVREEILDGDRERAIKRFGLESGVPTLLVVGGGTGSAVINDVVSESLGGLTEFCQMVHLTGGKRLDVRCKMNEFEKKTSNIQHLTSNRYHQIDFLNVNDMADAYAAADVVVSRCGMSSMTELSALAKPAIFIPLADTHQEYNARLILEKRAGVVIWQSELTIDKLVKIVKDILNNRREALSENVRGLVKDGGEEMAALIKNM